MNEAFLHFIWKFQNFQNNELITTSGEALHIFNPGSHNHDSGPDFSEGRIKLGNIEWIGNVEIHINAKDWDRHGHSGDEAYDHVILHVVWKHDYDIKRKDASIIPTLELQSLVDPALLVEYKKYLNQKTDVLCAEQLSSINGLTWNHNLDKMLAIRLEQKSKRIIELGTKYSFDWEELAYLTLARNLGFSLNADVFEQFAKNTPLKILIKHAREPRQLEALLFGQAGFLEDATHSYQMELALEYDFLKAKYQLEGIHKAQWKFSKMRPTNFPSVRLIQLGMLLTNTPKLFSFFSGLGSVRELKRSLKFEFSDYWKIHYDFGKELKRGSNQMGNATLENLIINTISPLLAAYALHTGVDQTMEKALNFLEQLPPESNRFTRKFGSIGRVPASAFDSQAQLTLYKDFCNHKKCLNCAIGVALFNK